MTVVEAGASGATTLPELLQARSVRLRPVLPVDYAALHQIAHHPRVNATWVTRGRLIPLEEFPRLLWDGNVCAFTLCSRATDAPLGYIGLTNHDERTGTAYLSVFVDPGLPTASPAAGEGIALALHHAFTALGLRKVYAETTLASLPLLDSSAFSALPIAEEGRLRDHFPSGEGFLDSIVLAVYRDEFELKCGRLIGAIAGPERRKSESGQLSEVGVFDAVVDALRVVTGRLIEPDGGWLLTEDVGLDSLSIVEVIGEVEEQLNRNVDDQGVMSVRSVRDLVELFTGVAPDS